MSWYTDDLGRKRFEAACSQESNTTCPTPPMTAGQKFILAKMRAPPRTKKPRTPPRTVFKKQRARLTQSAVGISARRALIKTALEEVFRIKCAEKRAVAPGKRRRRRPCAKDVCDWLHAKKKGIFSLRTVYADLRSMKKPPL